MTKPNKNVDLFKQLKGGGKWLGAARKWVQRNRCGGNGNGEFITWGSSETIKPPLKMREVEELALFVAVAAIEEFKNTR